MVEKRKHKYYAPSYYKSFRCKCGECRNSCCEGWDITISLTEYYHLQTLVCNKRVRKRIDQALKIVTNPTKERYAVLSENYYCNCSLHDNDGYCLLQKECGENALPKICKIYPRSINNSTNQICVSNSCEKVIEMFLEDDKQITNDDIIYLDEENNINQKLDFNFLDYQKMCLNIMNNRNYSINERLSILEDLSLDMNSNSLEELQEKYSNTINKDSIIIGSSVENDLHLQLIAFKVLSRKSPSLYQYIEKIQEFYNINFKDEIIINNEQVEKYKEALNKFYQSFPKWQILFEKILINHMLYTNYPFDSFIDNNLKDYDYYQRFAYLLETYSFLKFIVSSLLAKDNEEDNNNLVDIISLVFRLVEHSSFERNIEVILNNEELFDKVGLNKLLI